MGVGEWSERENEIYLNRRKIDLRERCYAQIRTMAPRGIDCKEVREAFGTGTKRNGGETKPIGFWSFVDNGGKLCDRFRIELSLYIYSS